MGLLTFPGGEEWKSRRKIFVPFFHRKNLIDVAVPAMGRRALHMLQVISANPKRETQEGVDVATYMAGITLDILGEVSYHRVWFGRSIVMYYVVMLRCASALCIL